MKVLIADDDPVTCTIVRENLEREGYEVVTAPNGARAWTVLQEPSPPQIAILDWMMPEMNGLDVCRRIHERPVGASAVFALLLTSKDNPDDIVTGFSVGADDYITKPFHARELLARIRVGERLMTMQAMLADRAELAEHRYREIVRHAVDGIYHERPAGQCVSVNSALVDMLGYATQEELLMRDSAPLGMAPDQREHLIRLFKKHGLVQGFETRAMRKDGSRIWVAVSLRQIYKPGGELLGCEGAVQDISERKHQEEELRKTNHRLKETLGELRDTQQQIIQQERLSALGQIASGIAHDFNNNLTPIKGYCELLLRRPENLEDKNKLVESLQLIYAGASNAENVVRRLRKFYCSREEHEQFIPVELNKLVLEAISLTRPKWKDQSLANGVTIHIETELHKIPSLAGDTADLQEVLINLILNAVDAIHDEGTIIISTRKETPYIVLEVTDTGTGMSEEARRQCLEPFFSTKGARGTGLGLATVWGIIKRHDGIIDIESAPGQGTTFVIKVPEYTAVDTTAREHEEATPVHISPKRILFVEDDPQVRKVVMMILAEDGHTVEVASNGRDGLERFQKGPFDLVITDQAMPVMNGSRMAFEIKQMNPMMPIIMLTGFGDMIDATQEYPEGVDTIINKPVVLNELRMALANTQSHGAPLPDG